ncbi:MAG: exported protein of unknown function [Nitrospira sp.]
MNVFWSVLLVVLLWPEEETRAIEYTKEDDFVNACLLVSIVDDISATRSSYKLSGTCRVRNFVSYRWTAEGAYRSKDGRVQERIVLIDEVHNPASGEIQSVMTCRSDPWLSSTTCGGVQTSSQGQMVFFYNEILTTIVSQRQSPLTPGLQYDRRPLLAKREAALKAEAAAALQRRNQRITQGVQPRPARIAPIILSPTPNALFINGTHVPIKLAPPKGWVDTQVGLDGRPVNTNRMYTVRLERKDPSGNWVAHTTLPVGAVPAESPTGYTGFGSGTPPGGATSPGAWRLSAQMSSPTATGWSDWVEFVVTAPKKAIQKAPKMFGP